MTQQRYCKRLIEVDLPIRQISEYARIEKEKRRGHVPLLYIWPATRPPSACRAIICASLWLDPADRNCPMEYKCEIKKIILEWIKENVYYLSQTSYKDFVKYKKYPYKLNDDKELRKALLYFIAAFSDSEKANVDSFLKLSSKLTRLSIDYQSGSKFHSSLLIDTFAGGGAIPLEGLRVGADVFSGELNSVAAFYNKILLEYVPKYRNKLIPELEKWYRWIKKKAKNELTEYYPNDKDGSVPVAYLWARTINCEGPGCGVEIPLLRSLKLTRKTKGLRIVPDHINKKIDFEILDDISKENIGESTSTRGAAVCPICGYTTSVKSVRKQLSLKNGGANESRMFCVVTKSKIFRGRKYRIPQKNDYLCFEKASRKLKELVKIYPGLIPNELLPTPVRGKSGTLGIGLQGYGVKKWSELFNSRQLLSHTLHIKWSKEYLENMEFENSDFKNALLSLIALVINRMVDLNASLCVWQLNTPNTAHVFGRWALSLVMDYGEINPLADAGGSIDSIMKRIFAGLKNLKPISNNQVIVHRGSATNIPLPDNSATAFITDPPYYDAIPYSDLSNFFYVWMKRLLKDSFKDYFSNELADWKNECIMDCDRGKNKLFYEKTMEQAMSEGRRVLEPNGICIIVFAHKSTSGWESLLNAIINSGWIVTASWPIDTEMQSRLRAKNSATLSSSIHLVCRPRENPDGSLITDKIGDWRDVLQELPKRIHAWMPRLAKEGIVGADAIFSCLGPGLEIFSQYSHVEKANGDKVELREYLEQVWAVVAKEALNMIFEGAHTEGFEEDSRLTAMWLWTLSTANGTGKGKKLDNKQIVKSSGFYLEFDTARKIAQGLGAHLEKLSNIIEINGNKARLLPVSERIKKLFGKGSSGATYKRKKKENQLTLFGELKDIKDQGWSLGDDKSEVGKTVLDRVHQAMILFGAGRGEALQRFLIEEGVGKDDRFWKLAQALSALYSGNIDEKRWIDGVLARKKSFGF